VSGAVRADVVPEPEYPDIVRQEIA
jgi:hypothetical protein